jgi:hypothetical protein
VSLLHPEENVTVATNADGLFSLSGSADAIASAILVLTPDLGGCGDSGTGASLAIKLMSPPGSTTLTPLSTLIVSVMIAGNLTELEADEKIRVALGLPDTGEPLHMFDAIEVRSFVDICRSASRGRARRVRRPAPRAAQPRSHSQARLAAAPRRCVGYARGQGGADRHGPAARAQAVGGTGVEDAASWFKVDNALSVMIGLAKVHAFILQTAVTLTGEWSDNIDDPATRNATFAEHVRARPAPLRRSLACHDLAPWAQVEPNTN